MQSSGVLQYDSRILPMPVDVVISVSQLIRFLITLRNVDR